MGSLVLHYVEKVEVLPSHELPGHKGAYVTTLFIITQDGRFEISMHSNAPVEVK